MPTIVVTAVTTPLSAGPAPLTAGLRSTVTRSGVIEPNGYPEPIRLIRVTPGSPAVGAVSGLNVIGAGLEVETVSAKSSATGKAKSEKTGTKSRGRKDIRVSTCFGHSNGGSVESFASSIGLGCVTPG